MPAGSAFTRLCMAAAAAPARPRRADLHVHSSASDGTDTPEAVAEKAVAARLLAVALTDHDTIAGTQAFHNKLAGRVRAIVGVELTCSFENTEVHLLGYAFDVTNAPLLAAMDRLQVGRENRFRAMCERCAALGASVPEVRAEPGQALGQRHVAALLVRSGHVTGMPQAFLKYLHDPEMRAIPKERLPFAEGVRLVREAGGFTSLAHPSDRHDRATLTRMKEVGLQGVEGFYPWAKQSHGARVRADALALGFYVTGGSDCHGPTPHDRTLGTRGLDAADLAKLPGFTSET